MKDVNKLFQHIYRQKAEASEICNRMYKELAKLLPEGTRVMYLHGVHMKTPKESVIMSTGMSGTFPEVAIKNSKGTCRWIPLSAIVEVL